MITDCCWTSKKLELYCFIYFCAIRQQRKKILCWLDICISSFFVFWFRCKSAHFLSIFSTRIYFQLCCFCRIRILFINIANSKTKHQFNYTMDCKQQREKSIKKRCGASMESIITNCEPFAFSRLKQNKKLTQQKFIAYSL